MPQKKKVNPHLLAAAALVLALFLGTAILFTVLQEKTFVGEAAKFAKAKKAYVAYEQKRTIAGELPSEEQPKETASCIKPPSGMLMWLRGEGNAKDSTVTNNALAGTSNALLVGKVTYGPGLVGKAFNVHKTVAEKGAETIYDSHLQALATGQFQTASFTLEGWFKPDAFAENNVKAGYFGKKTASQKLLSLYAFHSQKSAAPMTLFFDILTEGGEKGFTYLIKSGQEIKPAQWNHLALAYGYDGFTKKAKATLFINGNIVGSTELDKGKPDLLPAATWYIGANGALSDFHTFDGMIDEVSFYDHALTQQEVQGIYGAGSKGKCV